MEYGVTVLVNSLPTARSEEHLWHPMPLSHSVQSSAGVEINQRSVLGYPPLWRAINLISSSVAGLPFDIFRRQRGGGKKVDQRHPAQRLIEKKANRFISAYTFRKSMTALALLHGNAYAAIDRSDGRPVGLVPWDPQQTILKMEDGDLWYITYVRGEAIRMRSEDMIHIRGLGGDGICGWPIMDLMKDALGVGMAAQQFGGRYFKQGSQMSGLLMIPGHFTEEKIRNTMSAWNSMQQGLSNAHKVALLQDGVKFQQLTINNDAAQFIQTREFEVRQTVSNITGVPPHMLGDSTRTSHNSLESESQSYLDYTLQPWLQTWESEVEDKLLTQHQRDNDTHIAEFNREALVQMTFADKINGIYRQIESGILSRNEGRAMLNLPSLGHDGNEYYHPANWVVVGAEPVTPGAMPKEGDDMEPEETDNKPTAILRAIITSSVTSAIKIEKTRVVQRAGIQSESFPKAVDEFYATWTQNTLPELVDSDSRTAVIAHAEESKRLLADVHSVSTSDSLKANVSDVVASWDARAESLIESLMKVVQ